MTVQYIASEGERWDTVSLRCYGTPYEVDRLLQANPNIPFVDRLEGGTVLEVPVLENMRRLPDPASMPPWKRNVIG